MDLHLAAKTITVPDVIYLDQLAQLNLKEFEDLQANPDQNRYIDWVINFFKVMEIKERISAPDFFQLYNSGEFTDWLNTLTAGFQLSK